MTDLSDDQLLRFNAYVEGELDAAERSAFEAELAANPALRAEFEAFEAAMKAVSSLARNVPRVDLRKGVERKIRRRSGGRFFDRGQRLQQQLFISTAALFLVGVTVLALVVRYGWAPPEGNVSDGSGGPVPTQTAPGLPPRPATGGAPAPTGGAPSGQDPGGQAPGDTTGALPVWNGEVGDAAPGRVVEQPTLAMARSTFGYEVVVREPDPDLERRLRNQFGAANVRREETQLVVSIREQDRALAIERVKDLGDFSRKVVEARPDGRTEIVVHLTGAQ